MPPIGGGGLNFRAHCRFTKEAQMKIAIVVLLLLAGCGSSPYTPPPTAGQQYGAKCGGYGFTRGTDAYAGCLQKLEQADVEVDNAVARQLFFPK